MMVVDQVRAYLEDGAIANAVNFPSVEMPRESPYRVAIANANVPNMLGQISTTMAQAGLNIHNMVNKSRGEMAYTLVDVDSPVGTARGRRAGGHRGRAVGAGDSRRTGPVTPRCVLGSRRRDRRFRVHVRHAPPIGMQPASASTSMRQRNFFNGGSLSRGPDGRHEPTGNPLRRLDVPRSHPAVAPRV